MLHLKQFVCGTAVSLLAITFAQAQLSSPAPAPVARPTDIVQPAAAPAPVVTKAALPSPGVKADDMLLVQATAAPIPATSPVGAVTLPTGAATNPTGAAVIPPAVDTTTTPTDASAENAGVGVREFQGDDVGQVLRLLARQAKINMVVSDQIPPGSSVTMRLENVTALQAIEIIAQSKGLIMKKLKDVYYVKTAAEQEKEATESGSYQFSYAQVAKQEALTVKTSAAAAPEAGSLTSGSTAINTELLALIKSQLHSGLDPQFDLRTNTVFYREAVSNLDNFRQFLLQIDHPTKQVMIEARLVEVTANPKQSYGIDWSGVTGGKTISYGGSGLGTPGTNKLVPSQTVANPGTPAQTTVPNFDANGFPIQGVVPATLGTPALGGFGLHDFVRTAAGALGGQFAILSIPQMSVTLSALNADSDAEFLANPRIVTADNLPAKIEIIRAQPVPELVPGGASQGGTLQPPIFNGFKDKTFGNTLLVKPSVNKDSFITLSVKPTISSKAFDQTFTFQGATVFSPVIDSRSLESNVLIKSGDTLAIGGLMQDEVRKARTKVPVMGDVPVLGYLFQSHNNERVKRNLLVFVTPTIIDQHYGTGLEDQVSGLHHSGEEYADPNGWRNNAKGAVRLVPTSHREVVAEYPKPGVPPEPVKSVKSSKLQFAAEAKGRD